MHSFMQCKPQNSEYDEFNQKLNGLDIHKLIARVLSSKSIMNQKQKIKISMTFCSVGYKLHLS